MKNLFFMGLIVAVLSLSAPAFSATFGHPDTLGYATTGTYERQTRSSLTVEYDKLDKREMKDMEDFTLDSNRVILKAAFAVHDRVDLIAKVGMAEANYRYTISQVRYAFDSNYYFAWGGGLKAKLLETEGGTKLIASADYLRYEVNGLYTKNDIDWSASSGVSDYRSEVTVNEWQVAAALSRKFDKFTPYGGVKYSELQLKNEITAPPGNLSNRRVEKGEADNNIGVFAGAEIDLSDKVTLNLEGRFLDESAFTVGLSLKY